MKEVATRKEINAMRRDAVKMDGKAANDKKTLWSRVDCFGKGLKGK